VLNQVAVVDLDVDPIFQALADPSRRMMLERLSRGPASVSELAQPLPMSLPGALQHIQALEASGLVRSEKVGRVRTCHIETVALSSAEQWIAHRRAAWEARLGRLAEVLAEQREEPGGEHDKPQRRSEP
jgi:DNA-binding transcriptional ArsR family regulator